MAISQSCGVRNLRALSVQASGRSISAAETARRSPSLAWNTLAIRSTAARGRIVADEMRDELGGDESSGGRMTAQVANRALAFRHTGLGVFHAQHSFRSGLVKRLFKRKAERIAIVGGAGVAGARAAPAPCGRGLASPPTVHPVRIFASSCTSCCV